MNIAYQQALRQVDQLSVTDQLRLLEEVAARVRVNLDPSSRRSILELRGLGKDIWQGMDAQTYVDWERDSWSG